MAKKRLITFAGFAIVILVGVGFLASAYIGPTPQKYVYVPPIALLGPIEKTEEIAVNNPTTVDPEKPPTSVPAPTPDTKTDSPTAPKDNGKTEEKEPEKKEPENAPEPEPICALSPGGGGTAPSVLSPEGVKGTTTDDIRAFSKAFNAIREANCMTPVAPENFRYDQCMEERLFWIAEDPSEDPTSAWGHIGSVRSDGVPSVGCDGNLAGGYDNTGEVVAEKWWDSMSHRLSLYRPGTSWTSDICIYFAMTHGGVPNEPENFTRAAAKWDLC